MPRDISSSSSEDEVDNTSKVSPVNPRQTDTKPTRYQCPADFVSFHYKPRSSTLTESLKSKKTELWLIKAPASFNPECFSGIKVPLSGLQTLKVPSAAGGAKSGSGQQIYSVLASTHGTSELRLLTSGKMSPDTTALGPTFSGLLSVCESYGDSSANQSPQVIPAAPAPSIPLGLKQRFLPFGSKPPTLTCVPESEVDGANLGPSSAALRPLATKRFAEETWQEQEEEEEEEEGRKKKKKKKKEKRIKTEREEEEEVRVKEEPGAEIQDVVMTEVPLQEGDASEEKRKKKKKKKDKDREREREEVEQGMQTSVSVKEEEITVKCETIDTLYGDVVEGSGKKKKKKKKSRPEDD